MKKKILRFMAFLCLAGVVIYNVCWFYNYYLFTQFTDGLDELEKFNMYSILEDDYIYDVAFPSYLSFTGNLCVSTGNNEYSLLIWPSRYKDTEYGVMIPSENDSIIGIMVNRELEAEDKFDQPYVEQCKKELEILFEKADARWGKKFW